MTLLRWVRTKDGVHRRPDALGYAYRIADDATWNGWLSRITGYPHSELEVTKRTLRVRDQRNQMQAAAAVQDSQPLTAPVAEQRQTPPSPPAVVPAVKKQTSPEKQGEPVKPAAQGQVVVSAAVAAGAAPPQSDSVKDRILALVVEKTGYPADMLDLDLDMEADLGVDTVKQAEIFAAIREIYDIPRDENRKLRDYPTLAHVIRFVYEKRPDLGGAASATQAECAVDVPAESP